MRGILRAGARGVCSISFARGRDANNGIIANKPMHTSSEQEPPSSDRVSPFVLVTLVWHGLLPSRISLVTDTVMPSSFINSLPSVNRVECD